jgi:hypothetical protein
MFSYKLKQRKVDIYLQQPIEQHDATPNGKHIEQLRNHHM